MSTEAEPVVVDLEQAHKVAEAALKTQGASAEHATSTAGSVVAAEAEGNALTGFAHLLDYCDALANGRIDGNAEPEIEAASESLMRVDAREGLPHLGVDEAWAEFTGRVGRYGVAILALRNGYTCGALGYFARRMAEHHGYAALVAANAGPAVMPAAGGRDPVFCTNPLAFAMPCVDHGAIVVDQSSASGTLVAIRQAAAENTPIPSGWALGPDGQPTTDAQAALDGTLLPFGGYRGSNIALLVELLAAGLTGANWSHRAPAFNRGNKSPGVGLLIIGINPSVAHGEGIHEHLSELIEKIREDTGTYLPGSSKSQSARHAQVHGVAIDRNTWDAVMAKTA